MSDPTSARPRVRVELTEEARERFGSRFGDMEQQELLDMGLPAMRKSISDLLAIIPGRDGEVRMTFVEALRQAYLDYAVQSDARSHRIATVLSVLLPEEEE